MNKNSLLAFIIASIAFISCQPELNFETNVPSKGSLQDDATGSCLPKTVNGSYNTGSALSIASHTISMQVNVSQTGTYTISTDTVNGYSFRATGTFNVPGPANIILRGNGTPIAAGTDNFTVKYDTSVCNVAVTVLPGTTSPAVFSFTGAGGPCTGAVVAGTYAVTTALNSTNKVTLAVNVITAGSYNIATTFQGMTFSGSGVFTTTGANTVVLTGSGSPTTAGTNTVPVTAGSSNCSFVLIVGSPAVLTMDCSSATINGTYQAGTALTASNTVDIPVNVVTAGAYSITTTAVNGMVFSNSGSISAGAGTITLTGSGIPLTAGTSSIPVSFGAATCAFNVTVTAGATVNWRFTQGATTYQGSTTTASTMTVAGFLGFTFTGGNTAGDIFLFSLGDFSGAINASENYSTATSTSNSAVFQFLVASSTDTWDANPSTTGATVIFTVTSHNTTTKTIIGTFTGNAKNGAGNILPITAGTFTVVYQ